MSINFIGKKTFFYTVIVKKKFFKKGGGRGTKGVHLFSKIVGNLISNPLIKMG